MASAWDWEKNAEWRDGKLYGKPGTVAVRYFYDDGTGLVSPFVRKQGIGTQYGQRLMDPKEGAGKGGSASYIDAVARALNSMSSGELDLLNNDFGKMAGDKGLLKQLSEINDSDMTWDEKDAATEKLIKANPVLGAWKRLQDLIRETTSDDFSLWLADIPFFSFLDVNEEPLHAVTGEHEMLSNIMIPSREQSVWHPRHLGLNFRLSGDELGSYLNGSPKEIFNQVYSRGTGGKQQSSEFFNNILLDNFFNSRAFNSMTDADKRLFENAVSYFPDIQSGYRELVLNRFGDKIKNPLLRRALADELNARMGTYYFFDPNPSGSAIDDRLLRNAIIDKFVEGLADVGFSTMDNADEDPERDPENVIAGVVALDGERLVDNLMRSRGDIDLAVDTPAEGLSTGLTPLYSKTNAKNMLQKNIPKYIEYRQKGSDADEAYADKGSLQDVLGPLGSMNSDERTKNVFKRVVNETGKDLEDYISRSNIANALTQGPGQD